MASLDGRVILPEPPHWSAAELTFLWRVLLAVVAWWLVTLTRKPTQRRRWYRDWLLPFSFVMSFFVWPWFKL